MKGEAVGPVAQPWWGNGSVLIRYANVEAVTFNAAGTLTLSGATLVLGNALAGLGGGTLRISAATLDRLITVPGGVLAFYTGGESSVPLQAVLFGPNGQRVFGLESYVTSEAGQAAMAALIAQGYTVPDPPGLLPQK